MVARRIESDTCQVRTLKRLRSYTPVVIVHGDVECGHHIQQVITRAFEDATRLVIGFKVQVPALVSVRYYNTIDFAYMAIFHASNLVSKLRS